MNVEELIGKNVTLTKLESTRYRDGHPNGIEPGYVACGKLISARVGGMAEVIGPRGFLGLLSHFSNKKDRRKSYIYLEFCL